LIVKKCLSICETNRNLQSSEFDLFSKLQEESNQTRFVFVEDNIHI